MPRQNTSGIDKLIKMAVVTLDEDSRVTIPKPIRLVVPWLQAKSDVPCFLIPRVGGKLQLEPESGSLGNKIRRALTLVESYESEAASLDTDSKYLIASIHTIQLDKQKRLTIPEDFRKSGLLTDENDGLAIIFTDGKSVEFWTVRDWQSQIKRIAKRREELIDEIIEKLI